MDFLRLRTRKKGERKVETTYSDIFPELIRPPEDTADPREVTQSSKEFL